MIGASMGNSLGPDVDESTGDGPGWVPPWKFGAGAASMIDRGSA